jgi:hypothetical protein
LIRIKNLSQNKALFKEKIEKKTEKDNKEIKRKRVEREIKFIKIKVFKINCVND